MPETTASVGDSRSPNWRKVLAPYAQSDDQKAIIQLLNTALPYAGLWVLMILAIQRGLPYAITLALSVVAGLFLVRLFIFFHDCGHGSFFSSRRANVALGYVTGVLTFTPFHAWTHSHARHHATVGNLDKRGQGDVWTMTVEEYQAASPLQRLSYRLYRHPLILLGLGPIGSFLLAARIWTKNDNRRDRISIIITNLAIVAIIVLASLTIGLKTYVLIQLPVIWVAGIVGIWLFYVQHQYEGVYWARQDTWDPMQAALVGSSYLKLPRVLQWLTGNIGLHHIHHLNARIPNYHLQRCQDEISELHQVRPLSLLAGLKTLRLNLWDEGQQQMAAFHNL